MKVSKLGKILITGGTGFIGSALTKRLVREGCEVVVLDNNIRGSLGRLEDVFDEIDYHEGDVTKFDDVFAAMQGVDTVFHLAYINGTNNFYNFPEKVLEVGVKGALTTLDAAMQLDVDNYVVTSSSEVYQQATHFPTTENERIIVPDINNPRFSYSGGKIITELLTIHYTAKTKVNTIICRPHNFYGPDMGMGHVIPQFVSRIFELSKNFTIKTIDFPIQGTGEETRAFCFIEDAVDGLILSALEGQKGQIYHIGTEEEISINELATKIADQLDIALNIKPGKLLDGSTDRRCPSIEKISKIGFSPQYSLSRGLDETVKWYVNYLQSNGLVKSNSDGLVR